ncbi:hypothetical protein AEAC466_10710 [Asticcacaulis sp. AC466]|uniref:TonB-dependent receptor n=1 Tax=Asticcacaulis sp. AC466 TaxID=1282362 RepID=UPI0003C3D769|nr:TonB-dependent receptor [Asticcacaulis sp. AC466]ESQ84207.1 hypothetical protein AEAC466_10710 [Asticcacaulis sp. AC466]
MFNHYRLPTVRSSVVALVIGAALLSSGVAIADDRRIAFDIPAETTAAALNDLATQADIHLLFPYDAAARTSAPALKGTYSIDEALALVMAGAGLEIAEQKDGSISLRVTAGKDDAATEVIVTGSHIRGGNPTSPVHTVTRADIDASGYSQIGDVMRSLPENFAGGQNPGVLAASNSNIANMNITNASTMNLRGLGSDATLVLVNGHRLAADSSFQGADISVIPLSAVKRIEIVPDGASALYGSDAVAGVANIILRKTFNGAEVSARLGTTTQGGGAEQTYSLLAGRAGTTGYVMLNLEYAKQDAILAGDRAFASDVASDATLIQPQVRRSAFVSLGRDLTDTVSVSLDALVSDRDTTYLNHMYRDYPGYTGWAYTPAFSVTAMADVALSGGWKAHITGGVAGSRNSTGISSYGVDYPSYNTNHLEYIEATADGTLFSLPGGPLKVAVGGGVRTEGFQQNFRGSPSLLTPSRQVDYVYLEGQVPLIAPSSDRTGLHALELNLSARIEHYSDFGSTTNPRVGIRYVPFNDLTLRASWGQSFKAPSFLQMYQAVTLALYKPGILGGSNDGSIAMLVYGGNTDLKPETSTSWSLGADYAPARMPGLTLSLNLFNIDYTDRVVQPINPLTASLSNPQFEPFLKIDPATVTVETLVANAYSLDNYSGLTYDPNKVSVIIYDNYQNATAQTAHGVDLGYRQHFTLAGGALDAFANATWLHLEQQTIATQPKVILSGTIFNAPEFKARGGVTWQKGGLSLSGIVNYLGEETDTGVTPNHAIASWTTVDTHLAYNFAGRSGYARDLKLALSVSNLLDRDPPYAPSPALFYEGLAFDSTNASLIGRTVSLTLTKGW